MFDRKPKTPSPMSNDTIPQKALNAIAKGLEEGRPAIFHGGCIGCVWSHMNTTHAGIAFCRGCSYFAWDRNLPDKRREADEEPQQGAQPHIPLEVKLERLEEEVKHARPLIDSIAAWERNNGTIAAIMPDEYDGFMRSFTRSAIIGSARGSQSMRWENWFPKGD